MPMQEALVARLQAVAGLAGVRVQWFDRPRAGTGETIADVFAAGCIVLGKVSPGREWTHDGPDGLDEPRIQFDYMAIDRDKVAAIARATQAEMEQPRDVAGWRFHEGMIDTDFWQDPQDVDGGVDGTLPVYLITQDYFFLNEPV